MFLRFSDVDGSNNVELLDKNNGAKIGITSPTPIKSINTVSRSIKKFLFFKSDYFRLNYLINSIDNGYL